MEVGLRSLARSNDDLRYSLVPVRKTGYQRWFSRRLLDGFSVYHFLACGLPPPHQLCYGINGTDLELMRVKKYLRVGVRDAPAYKRIETLDGTLVEQVLSMSRC